MPVSLGSIMGTGNQHVPVDSYLDHLAKELSVLSTVKLIAPPYPYSLFANYYFAQPIAEGRRIKFHLL